MANKTTYGDFLEGVTPTQLEVINYLDTFFTDHDSINRVMRYRVPFYDYKSWLCYINPKKNEHLELVFLKGQSLSDPFKILQANGRKMSSGLMINCNKDLLIKEIGILFNLAFEYDKASNK